MTNVLWSYLLQHEAEADPGFRRQMQQTARRGLRIIGLVSATLPAVVAAVRTTLGPSESPEVPMLWLIFAIPIGLVAYAVGRSERVEGRARFLGCLTGFLVAVPLIWSGLLEAAHRPEIAYTIPTRIMLLLMIGLVALPLRPIDTLVLGFSVEAAYLISLFVAVSSGLVTAEAVWSPEIVGVLFILICLATVLSAVLYGRVFESYRAHQKELRAAQELHRAETRVLLSENAASIGRFAATLSHELNSPLGALRGAVDTLASLLKKRRGDPEEASRLNDLEGQLHQNARASVDRLAVTVARMQRMTNLDRAELHPVDVNVLLEDVLAVIQKKGSARPRVELHLEPLREVTLRPDQMSAVFSNLLQGALDANRHNGRVSLSTCERDSNVEVRIDVPGDLAGGLRDSFEPGFRVIGKRVSGADWSMFSARQIVREHGGDIAVESVAGATTRLRIVLPVVGP